MLKRVAFAVLLFAPAAPVAAQEEGDEVPDSAKRRIRQQFGEDLPPPKKEGEESPAEDEPPAKKKRRSTEPGRGRAALPEPGDEPSARRKATAPPTADEESDEPSPRRRRQPPAESDADTAEEAPPPRARSRESSEDEPRRETRRRRSRGLDEGEDSGGIDARRDSDDLREVDRQDEQVRRAIDEEPELTRTILLGVGGTYSSLVGFAARLPLSGKPTDDYLDPGRGVAFRLAVDMPFLTEADLRIGIHAGLPGFGALQGMAGVTRETGIAGPVKFYTRGGGGLEIFFATAPGQSFVAPAFVGEGEFGAQVELGGRAALGLAIELLGRYAIPLGFGFGLGGTVRVWFLV